MQGDRRGGLSTADLFVLADLILLEIVSLLGNLLVARPGVDKQGAPYLLWVAAMSTGPLIQLVISMPRFASLRERYGTRLFLLDLLVVYGVVLSPLRLQGSAGLPMASTLILFRGRTRRLLLAGQVAAIVAIDLFFWPANAMGKSHPGMLHWLIDAVGVCLEVYGVTRFAQLTTTLRETRQAAVEAGLAVERLRAGRDVHDLLGLSLTSIILRLELAIRRRKRGEDASAEFAEIAALTDRALAEVRTVATGEPVTSLAAETASARSALTWAGIRAEIDLAGPELEPAADAALALVLREAVTNVLRHSRATRCVIRLTTANGRPRLEISNDGAPLESRSGGTGLGNLTARLAPLGGQVTVCRDGEWFRLTADLAVCRRERPSLGGVAWAIGVMSALAVLGYLDPEYWQNTPAAAALADMTVMALGVVLISHIATGTRLRPLSLAVLLTAGITPALLGLRVAYTLAFAGAAVLFMVGGRLGWALSAAIAITGSVVYGGGPAEIATSLMGYAFFQTLMYALFRLAGLVEELTEARAELARISIVRERLRFGRDLRDRLGSGLFAVARHTAAHNPGQALAHARATSEEIRAIARGEGP